MTEAHTTVLILSEVCHSGKHTCRHVYPWQQPMATTHGNTSNTINIHVLSLPN